MKLSGPVLIGIAAVLWGTDAIFRKPLTGHVSSIDIVLLEHLFGLGILLPLLVGRMQELKTLRFPDWLAVAAIGIGGSALATVMFTTAFSYVSPSVAILLQKVQPLVAILLAVSLLKERLKPMFWLWAIIAIGAMYVVSFPNLHVTWSIYNSGNRGVILALGAAVLWGASTVFGRYAIKKISYPTMSALRFLVAVVTLFIVMLVQGNLPSLGGITGSSFYGLIGIVLFSGTTPILLYYKGLKTTRASVTTMVELLFPLSAVILNWIFLKDKLVWQQIVGGAVLIYAIIRIQMLNRETTSATQREFIPASVE